MMSESTLVAWKHVDIRFKRDLDEEALFLALEPPQDVLDNRSPAEVERDEDTLESRLRAWGWGTNQRGPLEYIGCYYDYTTLEDDERFMPLIAPFVAGGSIAVFELRDGYSGPEGWVFEGGEVRRGKADSHTDWWVE